MGSEKSSGRETPRRAVVRFASAREADARIAGVAAAARIVRGLAEAGTGEVWLAIGDGAPLAEATLEDVDRLRGGMPVSLIPCAELAGPDLDGAIAASRALPAAAEILRRTGKPGDGPVSRWLNRPISRRLSLLALRFPGARPIHATAATALLALAMFAALVSGGGLGLILGGLLFHAASVVDGVDGEIARATFRATPAGATLDSAVDFATNILFVLGMTISLAMRDGPLIGWVGAWGLGLFIAGALLIAWRVRFGGVPVSLNLIKERYRSRFSAGLARRVIEAATVVTSRDFFALLFALLILAGLETAILYIFATAATVWIWFVLGLVFVAARPAEPIPDEIPQCSAGA